MTEPMRESNDKRLLDLQLDRLSDQERISLRDDLSRDAALAARNDRLARVLARLDRWSVADAPHDLADRVLDFVQAQATTEPVRSTPATVSASRFSGGSWFRFREIVAAAACVGLLVGVIIPGMSNARDRSRRAMCASNLGTIFTGTSAYQQVFNDCLPYAGFVPGSTWLPTNKPKQAYASNSRHLFQLVRGAFTPRPETFICPSDVNASPCRLADIEGHDDFASGCNISYDALNLAAARPNLRPRPSVVYLGDPNPLFVNARFAAGVDPDTTNSTTHGGRGQTVLTLDGSVRWITSPIYGPKRDNLWLAGNIRSYTGCETPTSNDDIQLIPGCATRKSTATRR